MAGKANIFNFFPPPLTPQCQEMHFDNWKEVDSDCLSEFFKKAVQCIKDNGLISPFHNEENCKKKFMSELREQYVEPIVKNKRKSGESGESVGGSSVSNPTPKKNRFH